MNIKNIASAVAFASLVSFAHADFDKATYISDLKSGDVHETVMTYLNDESADVVVIVKQAIITSEASVKDVAKIVRAAIIAKPESARVIYTAALAVAPDAHEEVLEVYYELTSNQGDGVSDAKGTDLSKGGKAAPRNTEVARTQNPLDFPTGAFGNNVAGTPIGTQGGWPLLRAVAAANAVAGGPAIASEEEPVSTL